MRRGLGLVAWSLALAAIPVMAKTAGPPPLRGVVEGYYGRPWSGEARRDVVRFMGAHGLDTFVYGPKNDPYHRDRWREPYPGDALADLRETARVARRAGVAFVYALSPGLDVCYACRDDFRALTRKLAQVARAGVRRFALFFDDIAGGLGHPEDVARYGEGEAALARAHAELANRADRWLRAHGRPAGIVLVVPSDYAGTECHPYHDALAATLRRSIAIGWTGTGVFAPTLGGADARAFAACLHDRPIVFWDNYPVNDTVLSPNLHLGPLTGRDGDLARTLRGHLLNPMTQAHASLVALGTAAAYFRDPQAYDPEAAWRATLAELDPSGGLAILAEQVRSSPLDLDDARPLAAAVAQVDATYPGAGWEPALDALDAELARQAAAPATIAAHLGGTPLGDEVAPWVAELAAHATSAAGAVALLRAMKPGFADVVATLEGGMLHVTGRAFGPDEASVAALGPTYATAPRVPTIGELLACLGVDKLTTAEIRFCPELGLNVHGKALALIPFSLTRIETVTGRNVHQNFLARVAVLYADHQSRQGPGANALAVTLDGGPLALAAGGGFAATIALPASGHAVLRAATAAGDATERAVP